MSSISEGLQVADICSVSLLLYLGLDNITKDPILLDIIPMSPSIIWSVIVVLDPCRLVLNYCYEPQNSHNIRSMHELTLCILRRRFYEQFKCNKLPAGTGPDTILPTLNISQIPVGHDVTSTH